MKKAATWEIGDRVYWVDPDPETQHLNGFGIVVAIHGEGEVDAIYSILRDDGGAVEAWAEELHERRSND